MARRHQVDDEDERGGDVGGGEEGREMRARDQLNVAQRRIFGIGPARREPRRFATGKTRGNQPFVSVWCLVHGPHTPAGIAMPYPKRVDGGLRSGSRSPGKSMPESLRHTDHRACARRAGARFCALCRIALVAAPGTDGRGLDRRGLRAADDRAAGGDRSGRRVAACRSGSSLRSCGRCDRATAEPCDPAVPCGNGARSALLFWRDSLRARLQASYQASLQLRAAATLAQAGWEQGQAGSARPACSRCC